MSREIFVFVSKGCVDQLRRNVTQRSPDPKFLVRREGDTKQFDIPIAHTLRKRNAIEQRRLRQAEPDPGCNDEPTTSNPPGRRSTTATFVTASFFTLRTRRRT